MAKVIIELIDLDNGGVSMEIKSDPVFDQFDVPGAMGTPAQMMGAQVMQALQTLQAGFRKNKDNSKN